MSLEITASGQARSLAHTILKVAWYSIGLGILMQLSILIVSLFFGKAPGLSQFTADLTQKVSWSTLVCLGLATGKLLSRSAPVVTGIAGFFSAPLAFTFASAVQKSVAQALGLTGSAPAIGMIFLLAAVKAVQYGLLGWTLCKFGHRFGLKFKNYVLIGLLAGIIFGGLTLFILSPLPALALISRGINEILFPAGCAVVVYLGDRIAKAKVV
jgi:hypothetical protein